MSAQVPTSTSPEWLASGRIPALDGLRAVAISIVLLAHAHQTSGFPDLGRFGMLLRFGSLGVDVFFVLSGFLITTLLCREAERSKRVNLRAFYARRVIRIVPAYVCFLVFVAALQTAGHADVPGRDWLAALTYTMNFQHRPPWEVGHLWSLSIEEHYYLLWPPLFALLPPRLAVRALLAVLAVQPMIRWTVLIVFPTWTPMTDLWTFTRFDTIAAGSLLALLARDPSYRTYLDCAARYWLVAFGALVGGLGVGAGSGKLAVSVTPGITAVSLAILVWAASRRAGDSPPSESIARVVLGDDVWIGNGAMILKGVTIGDRAIIAARAVVTKDVPPDTIVAGNPARVVRELAPTPIAGSKPAIVS